MKKTIAFLLVFTLLTATCFAAPQIKCKSALLMEQSTGKVLFEYNSREKLPPASVTKVMTMLLAMEAIDGGNLKYDDIVIASERAKSMGGSTIFLDAGEEISVNDLLKGIAVASGNDACVAIGEHIAGSESDFVMLMNNRAKELGMEDTTFHNTNGLPAEGHVTSARDIALMSRELLKHTDIFKYTTIWTDSLRNGEFGLANTNKLIRFYSGANGLKTGSTDEAGFCISATAKRDDMQLIAVVMGSETSSDRFESAKSMLDFGFANYCIVKPAEEVKLSEGVKVLKGESEIIKIELDKGFETMIEKKQKKDIKGEVKLPENVTAPVKKGDKIGEVEFKTGDEILGKCSIIAAEDVNKKGFAKLYLEVLRDWLR